MNHNEMMQCLTGKAGQCFVEAFIMLQRPWSAERRQVPRKYSYTVFPEFDLVEPWVSKHIGAKRPDAMMEISFPQIPLSIMDDVQIVVEFKDTVDDLMQMDISKYDGYSDYVYLAIPTELMQRALSKVEANPHIGVFDITTGRILRLSKRQSGISIQRRFLTYGTMLTKYIQRWDYYVWPVSGFLPNAMLGLPQILPRFKKRSKSTVDVSTPQEIRRALSCHRIIFDVRVATLRWVESDYLYLDDYLDVFYSMMDKFRKMAETMLFSDFENLDHMFPQFKTTDDIDGFLQRVL